MSYDHAVEQFEAALTEALIANALDEIGAEEVGEREYDVSDSGQLQITVRGIVPLPVEKIRLNIVGVGELAEAPPG